MVTLGVFVVVVDDVIGVAVFSVVSKTMSSIVVVLIDVVGETVVVVAGVVVVVASVVVVFIVVGEGVAGCTEPSDEKSTTKSKHYVNILSSYTNVCLPKPPKRTIAENVLFCLFYFFFGGGGGGGAFFFYDFFVLKKFVYFFFFFF